MYAKKRKFPLTIILIFVLLGILIGSVAAKYIYSEDLSAKVIFTAELADALLVQEHEAVRQLDGSYTLNTNLLPKDEKKGNSYELLPGLDVPKNPFVTVVNKTPIGAYLYIEVIDTTNGAITYEIDTDNWTKLSITGREVYVYEDGTILTNKNCPTEAILILKDNKVTVSQTLLTKNTEAADVLTFSAYLYEVHDGKTATEIFTEKQNTT